MCPELKIRVLRCTTFLVPNQPVQCCSDTHHHGESAGYHGAGLHSPEMSRAAVETAAEPGKFVLRCIIYFILHCIIFFARRNNEF